MRVIPLKACAGVSGFGSLAVEYQQNNLSLDELLIAHPSSTFLGQASGDSMQGVGIFDGDVGGGGSQAFQPVRGNSPHTYSTNGRPRG